MTDNLILPLIAFLHSNSDTMKILLTFFLTLFCCSCYRAAKLPATGTPTYDIIATSYSSYYGVQGSIVNNPIVVTTRQNNALSINLVFSLLSGNPTNYPFTFYADSLSPGITINPDSLSFLLNYSNQISLLANTDTGYQTINFKMYNSDLGIRIYPIQLHIIQ